MAFKKAVLGALGALSLMTTAARAEEFVTGDHVACTSREAFDEAIKAMLANDQQWFNSIEGCGYTVPGHKVVVLDRFLMSTGHEGARVRMFERGGTRILWTITENVVSASK